MQAEFFQKAGGGGERPPSGVYDKEKGPAAFGWPLWNYLLSRYLQNLVSMAAA